MKNLRMPIENNPMASTLGILVIALLLTQLLPLGLSTLFSSIEALNVSTAARYFVAVLSLFVLQQYGWYRLVEPQQTTEQRSLKRWLLMLPMLAIGMLNLTSVDWSTLQPSTVSVSIWLIDNLATGMFEESLMRGVIFLLLLNLWGHTRIGLFKAAIVQAALFGGLHLLNLMHANVIDVLTQVFYATILGVAFAGLMLYSRSILTVIIVHSFINACSSIQTYLSPSYLPGPSDPSSYWIAIPLIFILAGLPGIWSLTRVPLNNKVEV